jgi:hypothetical protein
MMIFMQSACAKLKDDVILILTYVRVGSRKHAGIWRKESKLLQTLFEHPVAPLSGLATCLRNFHFLFKNFFCDFCVTENLLDWTGSCS